MLPSSPRLDRKIVIYEGPKVIWSIHTTIDVAIVEHSVHFIIEILGFNPVTREESPRLYLDALKVDEKISAYEPVALAPESNQRLTPIKMTHETRNEFRKKFILARLGVNAKIHRHKQFELVMEPLEGERLRDIYCREIPSNLVSVAEDYFETHGSEPPAPEQGLTWQKSKQIDSNPVREFGSRRHDGNQHGLFHHNNEIIDVSNDDADIGNRRELRTRHERSSFDSMTSLWHRMRTSIFSTGESTIGGEDPTSGRYRYTDRSIEPAGRPSERELCVKSVDEEDDFSRLQDRIKQSQAMQQQQQQRNDGDSSIRSRHSTGGETPRSHRVRLSYGLSVLSNAASVASAPAGPLPDTKETGKLNGAVDALRIAEDGAEAFAPPAERRSLWRGRRMTVATVPDSNSEAQEAAAFTGGQLHQHEQHKDRRERERRRSFHRRRAGVLGQLGIGKNSHQVSEEA